MNKTLLGVGALSVVALVFSGVAYFRPPTLVEREIVKEVVKELGAFPGPDISSPYLTVNGVTTWYYESNFLIGTSTPCAFQLPVATSTILSWGFQQLTSTSSAVEWTIATSSASGATTTVLTKVTAPANDMFGLGATGSTTGATYSKGMQNMVSGPDTWLVFQGRVSLPAVTDSGASIGGAYLSSSSVDPLRGRCSAIVREL